MNFKKSRREFLKLATQSTAAMALLNGCSLSSSATDTSPQSVPVLSQPIPTKMTPDNDLDVKIGQMLLVGFRGLIPNEPIIRDIQDRHIGGVILFDYDVAQKSPIRNIRSPQQVKKLVKALQAYSHIPLLIAIDYEGGLITRLPKKYGFPTTVSHQYLGKKNNLKLTYQYAAKMAKTQSELGINLNFAPVVDLNINPHNPIIGQKKRSFSAHPEIVTRHALQFMQAHHDYQILCTLKHFPGHGSSSTDSHRGLVNVTQTWSEIELKPYQKLIQANVVDAIMTAHVFNRKLDSRYPATLSYQTVTGLLREQLGFNGVIFSDDLQMKAIANYYGLETAVQKAIEAGVDILVIGNNTGEFVVDIATTVATIIKRFVQEGTISQARIDESYYRIQRLKSQLIGV